ncbi:unnamed protein product [Onchocerca flexuosa]|uniref:DUF1758 domain-containing protein n=1 Tax=Onchocerca flexuosa TaxID=387005 RepID=A0A183I731_9BILA|nr:unnamed protein product [Onchocerca flexuosa]
MEIKSRSNEKILRQLEALGENLEHSSIEVTIENKLPPWILDKVYQMKTERETWTGKGTFALLITKQSTEPGNLQSSNKTKFKKEKRPCIFCNKNHCDNECSNSRTAKQRFERLKKFKACTNCFCTNHATSN